MNQLRMGVLGAAAVAAVVLPLVAAATAAAAPNPATPSPAVVGAADLTAARRAAESTSALTLIGTAAHHVPTRAGSAPAAVGPARFDAGEVPVYALDPTFVTSGSGPVATLWYIATTVHQAGTTLTVFTTKEHGSWQAVNVATGDTESRLAAQAGTAILFTEPQLGAWYALAGDRIRPLNAEARRAAGAASISVTTYQREVSARYAGRQRGSAYDKQGLAGGFGAAAPATARSEKGSATEDVVVPVALAASVSVGVGLVLRRRRLPA